MSLKDKLKFLQQETSSQEAFLAGLIKGEFFLKKYKKYKKYIIIAIILIVLFIAWKIIESKIDTSRLLSSNNAYLTLLSDANNTEAIDILKTKNSELYNLYLFKNATTLLDASALEKFTKEQNNFIISSLAKYQTLSLEENQEGLYDYSTSQKSLLRNLALLESGYLLLEQDNIAQGYQYLTAVSSSSEYSLAAQSFLHYGLSSIDENK